MRTIAQKYIEEGIQYGVVQGIEKGKEQGIQIGKAELVKMLLENGNSVELIVKMTGMPINKINELLKMQ